MGAIHLDTVQILPAIHSNRCLEAFHWLLWVAGEQLNRVHMNVTQVEW